MDQKNYNFDNVCFVIVIGAAIIAEIAITIYSFCIGGFK